MEMPLVNTITLGGVDETIYGDAVSGEYYSVLGLAPAAGRLLGLEDNVAPSPVAVISYAYWKRRSAARPCRRGQGFHRRPDRAHHRAEWSRPAFPASRTGRPPADFTVPLFMTEQINGGSREWRQHWNSNILAMMARCRNRAWKAVARATAEAEAALRWLAPAIRPLRWKERFPAQSIPERARGARVARCCRVERACAMSSSNRWLC